MTIVRALAGEGLVGEDPREVAQIVVDPMEADQTEGVLGEVDPKEEDMMGQHHTVDQGEVATVEAVELVEKVPMEILTGEDQEVELTEAVTSPEDPIAVLQREEVEGEVHTEAKTEAEL